MAADKTTATATDKKPPKKPAAGRTVSTKLTPVEEAPAKPAPKAPAKRAAKATPKAAAKRAAKPTPKAPAKRAAKPAAKPAPHAAAKSAPKAAAKPAPKAAPGDGKPTPEQVELWHSLGPDQRLALREREAVRTFAEALEHHNKGELADAVNGYGRALRLNPSLPDIYNNLGVALRALGKREAAVACYRRSLALKPDAAGTFTNLGNVLREIGRLDIAAASHRRAVELSPDAAETHYNLGLALLDMGEIDGGLEAFAKTLEINPDHVGCHWDRALGLLQKGELKAGFEEYEWRWKLEGNPPRGFTQPLWDGADLGGKTILLHQEQGFGDMIQFARYIPMVKEKGGTIIVETQPELNRLFSAIEGVGQVINTGSQLPDFEVYAPMLSLARIFGTTIETVPNSVPYLKAPDAHAAQLPASLGPQRKIGIAWAGNRDNIKAANRSIPFTRFIELMGTPETTLYSLQAGPPAADIAENGCEAFVINLGPRLKDFADTAAVISELDMVVTVDTAIAHLAGALGKPVWVVLPYAGDWRWHVGRDDTPWYPTMRLFRQDAPGDWDTVFEKLAKAFADEAGGAG